MLLKVERKSEVCGAVTVPSSKSALHRMLICASFSDGDTLITASGLGTDVQATIDCLRAMGVRIATEANDNIRVSPLTDVADHVEFDCRESASTLRFLLPLAAAFIPNSRFIGSGRLPLRPVSPLLKALKQNGTDISGETLPMTVGGGLKAGRFVITADISSQYVSGLLMTLPLLSGDSEIILEGEISSAPYVSMTLEIMDRFGVQTEKTDEGYFVRGNRRYFSDGKYTANGDWSAAAVFLGMGALGGRISVKGLETESPIQGDAVICDCLRSFGAELTTGSDVKVCRHFLKGIDVDVTHCPDLLPLLAILGSASTGKTVLYNAGRLRFKESDRLKTTASIINELGGHAVEYPDRLEILGTGLRGGMVSSRGDHRIAMAAAVAAAVSETPVCIDGAETVQKSYPGFFDELCSLGFDVSEI